jgi:hypothetical protein
MTLPSNYDIYELRYVDKGSTFSTSFTAADNAAWAADTAVKLRCHDVDLSGLIEEVVKDPSVQTRFHGRNPPIRVRRTGSFKFKMHLEGGSASTDPGTVATLLGCVLGGLHSPAAISDAVEAASTATQIKATAHGLKNNEIVLIGVDGDAGADGKASPIEDEDPNSDTNAFDVQFAFPSAPAESAVIKAGHACYVDDADESYQDFLFIGSHSGSGGTDDPDQIQMIGCSGKATIGGLGVGETPNIEFEFMVGNWQFVNYADQASFSHTTTPSGNDPVGSVEEGQFQIQDVATTMRNTIKGGNVSIDFGFDLVPIHDPGTSSRIGGWKKVRSDTGPMISISAYWANLADMPGLYNDFTSGTAKQVLYQLGSTAQNTVVFYAQRAYIQQIDPSKRIELERNTAIELTFECNDGGVTTLASAEDKLEDAPLVVSFN